MTTAEPDRERPMTWRAAYFGPRGYREVWAWGMLAGIAFGVWRVWFDATDLSQTLGVGQGVVWTTFTCSWYLWRGPARDRPDGWAHVHPAFLGAFLATIAFAGVLTAAICWATLLGHRGPAWHGAAVVAAVLCLLAAPACPCYDVWWRRRKSLDRSFAQAEA